MITKVAYRPYAQGVNNTQNQKQNVNFGTTAKDLIGSKPFGDALKETLESPNARILYVRLSRVLGSLGQIDPHTNLAEALPHLKSALTEAYTRAGK